MFQNELHKIVEEKLLRTQKRYYLNMKMVDFEQSKKPAATSPGLAEPRPAINIPKRLNRANLKLQAARVIADFYC